MPLNFENIAITGRIFEEYSAFFDLELEDLKKLEELFFKNINFLKSHREYTNSEMQNLKKMKRFLKN